jgi:hypothetical protein
MECPNCITPWKCNGPHLEMISNSVYKSEHGYFMLRQSGEWILTPVEKEFDTDTLLGIMDTLKNLNERHTDDL